MASWRCIWAVACVLGLGCCIGFAQIDPVKRDLLQLGYNAALQGHQPLSAYAFFYHNQPGFLRTNLTLRLALSPTYLDSELGVSRALGEHTDVGLGLAGGGFADSYLEVRRGVYLPSESFIGHGAELSASIYHLFNPGRQIPLNGILRASARYSFYLRDDKTAADFALPDDRATFNLRTGLRWGGREPTLFPSVAMELSAWYDGQLRTPHTDRYGFDDREMVFASHLFWGQAMLIYTLPESKQSFDVRLTAGTSIHPDRFSAYRMGGLLPLIAEYPLSLPGYYYQELSARNFALLSADYLLPLERRQRWNIDLTAATAYVDYVRGLEQPGRWHSGVGAGLLYRTSSWKFMVGYAYGVDAMRTDGRGAHSVSVLMQLDWGEARRELFSPASPGLWRGLQQVFGLFGS